MKCETVYRIFSAIPRLETERLLLRRMEVGDCYDMFEYAKDPSVTQYLTWNPHPDLEYTKEYLQYISNHYRLGDFYDWAVVLREENKMIGTCGFTRFHFPHNAAEVGYVINPAYRGRGIADEAVRAVMRFGFETIRRDEMLIKGQYRDVGVCAILREEACERGVF